MSQLEPNPTFITHYQVDFQPVGRRVHVPAGTDLLSAAQRAGVDLLAVCGGMGICASCLVRLVTGDLTPLTQSERDALNPQQLALGCRLACQASPRSDVRLEIPSASLSVGQRMQVEGQEALVRLDPVVRGIDVTMRPPGLEDLRSDQSRVYQTLQSEGYEGGFQADLTALSQLSESLRHNDWKVRLALHEEELRNTLVSVFAPDTALLGLAVDMGSTKLALYLVDLQNGATLAQTGVMNPQIAYGEDVVSRIAFANRSPENRKQLQSRLVEVINETLGEMCDHSAAGRHQVVDAVMVGNTAMHHLFCGLPVQQLGASPYVPAVSDPLLIRAEEVGVHLAPAALIYLPANIAGYVGADHTAALLSSQVYHDGGARVMVDIGTNTEISLVHNGEIHTCSTASGPAFEGAHIRDGMRAAPGAIDSVHIQGDEVHVSTISNALPVGICGTGILKAISEMLDAGLLDERGMLNRADRRVRQVDEKHSFVLVPAEGSGHGREIVVTRKDVNEIQLAKGAIRSGIDILLAAARIDAGQVREWVIAGAFGTYLDMASALRIGMFPSVPLERFKQVGNAAGMGAKQMLLARSSRMEAQRIVRQVHYIELTIYPGFTDTFLRNMYFP